MPRGRSCTSFYRYIRSHPELFSAAHFLRVSESQSWELDSPSQGLTTCSVNGLQGLLLSSHMAIVRLWDLADCCGGDSSSALGFWPSNSISEMEMFVVSKEDYELEDPITN